MNVNNTTIFKFSPEEGFVTGNPEGINRAFLFGDGLFETMVLKNNRIRFAKEHQERLTLGLQQLRIQPSGLGMGDLEEFVQQNFQEESKLRIRWNVYRGGLGKYTPLTNHSQDLILIQALEEPINIKHKTYISKKISTFRSPWSHCKTLNSLPYVMANMERKEMEMDEVVLLDDKGFVSEAGAANIFWVKDGVFYTPSLSCNCIAGVGRRKIIETLLSQDISVVEGQYLPNELLAADQAFTSNVTGISYLVQLENREFNTLPISLLERLFE
jgi:4-amino-4-deoxychorismate lyase